MRGIADGAGLDLTDASLLMDLTAGQFWLAAGNPCQAPYEQLTVKL
jgi:hypothetical protein